MTVLQKLQNSNMWHPNWHLPLSPQNNNPWFYCACAVKCVLLAGESFDMAEIYSYELACSNPDGTLRRWPSATSSEISQDELIGASYLNEKEAFVIAQILEQSDGYYAGQYFARFPWFIQYVKSRSGKKLGPISQVLWVYLLIWDMLTVKNGDASGRLTIWLQLEEMYKYFLCATVIDIWRWRMKRLGITPRGMFTLEPKENPVMAEIAPEEW